VTCINQADPDWAHQKKLHAARFAWKKRQERTPKGIKWDAWFEKMFGENLYKYAERKAKEKGS
tara:strand:- start:784 stop:972 length:189 start_codon:yes stop_codon:yes gene_type:complete